MALDLVSALSERNQHNALFAIFSDMCGVDLFSAKLTCKAWHQWIKHGLWGTALGRRQLKARLDENLRLGRKRETRATIPFKVWKIKAKCNLVALYGDGRKVLVYQNMALILDVPVISTVLDFGRRQPDFDWNSSLLVIFHHVATPADINVVQVFSIDRRTCIQELNAQGCLVPRVAVGQDWVALTAESKVKTIKERMPVLSQSFS